MCTQDVNIQHSSRQRSSSYGRIRFCSLLRRYYLLYSITLSIKVGRIRFNASITFSISTHLILNYESSHQFSHISKAEYLSSITHPYFHHLLSHHVASATTFYLLLSSHISSSTSSLLLLPLTHSCSSCPSPHSTSLH